MAHFQVEFRSAALGKAAKARVIVPDAARPPYPVYYLLHGLSDDESQWTRFTRIEEYAESRPFLIVMPDGARSFYCDSPLGRYERYVAQELVERIDGWFPTRAERSCRAVGGLSMGGYGAIKLGLKYPEVFGAALSHSGALSVTEIMKQFRADPNVLPDLALLAETAAADPGNDPFVLAERWTPERGAALYFDCGREDFLFPANEAFHARLEGLGVAHEYRVHAGAHTWSYWDQHIREALAFAAARLPD